jgi:hypothetical protein
LENILRVLKYAFTEGKLEGKKGLMETGHHKKSLNLEVPPFGMSKILTHATRNFSNYCHTKFVPH